MLVWWVSKMASKKFGKLEHHKHLIGSSLYHDRLLKLDGSHVTTSVGSDSPLCFGLILQTIVEPFYKLSMLRHWEVWPPARGRVRELPWTVSFLGAGLLGVHLCSFHTYHLTKSRCLNVWIAPSDVTNKTGIQDPWPQPCTTPVLTMYSHLLPSVLLSPFVLKSFYWWE